MKIVLFTALALLAFAFNSILCRLALAGGEADAAGFTAVRLASGAAALVLIASVFGKTKAAAKSGHWLSAFLLFAYAICFSLAYLGLTAATGALILFGSVQLTMIAVSLARGDRPSLTEWLGLAVAVCGLVYLVLPGLESPPLTSSLLMAAAGAAWGGYTLRGKGEGDPLSDTTGNFVRSLPFAAIALLIYLPQLQISAFGVLLAVISGAAASGVGYAVWYAALKGLTSTRAAVFQLSVPVIAAALAVVILDEKPTLHLLTAGLLILGGIAITIAGRKPPETSS
ncbi:MAG: DMT family transporter [Acidobacteriota bacterium]|nr:MAG: DMT family transporter [Acidobacteriota bacterium]